MDLRSWRSLYGCLLLLSFGPAASAADNGPLLVNGGLERPFRGGVAQGWTLNCYGENDAAFAEETRDVHGGASAQRVACARFVSGGVQFHSSDAAVEEGKTYTLRLWMKGDVKAPVQVAIRQHGAPYAGYLKGAVRVHNEWRPYVIVGEAKASDPRCGVYIMFAGCGTLLVDQVELLPGRHEETPVALFPPQKGNRVYNSGFEAGPEGWTPVGQFQVDGAAAHSGKHSARAGTMGIECRPFPIRSAQRYTLSAWIKAAAPGAQASLRLTEWADNGGDQPGVRNAISATLPVTMEWARYQVSGVLLPNMWEDYVARITPTKSVWVDDVQVEEGEAADYQPAQAVEVGVETATRFCLCGEPVEIAAHVAAAGPKKFTLRYMLEDLWARRLETITHEVEGGATDRAVFTVSGVGMHRVRVQADDAPATGETWFGVFPRRDRRFQLNSPFGAHVTATLPTPSRAQLVTEAMGARWIRLHDFGDFCHWRVVEPEKGRFEWRDAEVDALRGRGFNILANLGHPPAWAGRADPKRRDSGGWTNAPPRDPAEWENYIAKTVEHFRGRIRHWEIWNEPYGQGFFCGTPEEYAELLKIAYRTIKRIDPPAVVLGGCYTPVLEEWTLRTFDCGALDAMDALSYHVYWSPAMSEAPAPGKPAAITAQVQRYLELMRQRGHAKPIYMSEGGIRCAPFASWLPKEGFSRSPPFGGGSADTAALGGVDAASGLVRGMTQMLSAGVVNVCYYYTGGFQGAMPWFSTMANGYYVLLDFDGRPKPTLMAYSAMEQMLGDARAVKSLQRDGLQIHVFLRAKGAVAVAWSDRPRLLAVAGATVFDLMGNPRSDMQLSPGEPVYVSAPNLAPEELAAAIH